MEIAPYMGTDQDPNISGDLRQIYNFLQLILLSPGFTKIADSDCRTHQQLKYIKTYQNLIAEFLQLTYSVIDIQTFIRFIENLTGVKKGDKFITDYEDVNLLEIGILSRKVNSNITTTDVDLFPGFQLDSSVSFGIT